MSNVKNCVIITTNDRLLQMANFNLSWYCASNRKWLMGMVYNVVIKPVLILWDQWWNWVFLDEKNFIIKFGILTDKTTHHLDKQLYWSLFLPYRNISPNYNSNSQFTVHQQRHTVVNWSFFQILHTFHIIQNPNLFFYQSSYHTIATLLSPTAILYHITTRLV